MENSKAGTNEAKSTINSNEENPNDNNTINSSAATTVLAAGGGGESNAAAVVGNENEDSRQTRTPFTNLSQVDADLALARTLQEQVSTSFLYMDYAFVLYWFEVWRKGVYGSVASLITIFYLFCRLYSISIYKISSSLLLYRFMCVFDWKLVVFVVPWFASIITWLSVSISPYSV